MYWFWSLMILLSTSFGAILKPEDEVNDYNYETTLLENVTALQRTSSPTTRHSPRLTPPPRLPVHTSIYINLRLYYDDDLFIKMHRNPSAVQHFLLAMVHSTALSYKNRPLGTLGYKWHFIVQSIELISPEDVPIAADHEGNEYRQRFVRHYRELLLDVTYTSLVLFTGYNFRHQSNFTETLGLSDPGSACDVQGTRGFRGIIVEARGHRSAYVLAHELGHTLSVLHDEELGCPPKYIMSRVTGFGKTKFSDCSARKVKAFLDGLQDGSPQYNCFRYNSYPNPVAIIVPGSGQQTDAPYRSISTDEQCKMTLGEVFRGLPWSAGDTSICTRISCTNDLVNVLIYSALENTTCGTGKSCRAGKCRGD